VKKELSKKIDFPCGIQMPNPFMLAPMTNTQSHDDGRLSEEEFRWLTMRAEGGFGLTMTCASYVQKDGKGFPGQLGIYSDDVQAGHQRLAKSIKAAGSLAVIQLFHAGMRSPKELIGRNPMTATDQEKHNAKGISTQEVEQLVEDFVRAAKRAKKWGYDGVEIHGAHGYIIAQFLSAELNKREDQYGGSLENRSRLLFEIVDGVRAACGTNFLLGIRLSPERFGMALSEIKQITQKLIDDNNVDFLDISLWDWQKRPEEEEHAHKTLLQHFLDIDFKEVKMTVAGKIGSAADCQELIANGVDFVTLGKAAILHHNFPQLALENPNFKAVELPVSVQYLERQGLSEPFVKYMQRWPGFVED
jgi:2,4-dienoyl-CoA reductase-like NADH-dependent reductase (Old Yellow Enzyme family)